MQTAGVKDILDVRTNDVQSNYMEMEIEQANNSKPAQLIHDDDEIENRNIIIHIYQIHLVK
jgi:hypothetical protein